MQSYAREYLGKNQFWTPSSIGLTNSLIDNKLNNLDEIDTSGLLSKNEANETYLKITDSNSLLSKNEANETYLKITDAIVPKFHSFSVYNNDGFDMKQVLTNIGTASERIQIDIPSTVGNGIKLVYVDFRVFCLKKAALDALTFTLNNKTGTTSGDNKEGKMVKGICVATGDGRSSYKYKYYIHDVFKGKIKTLYLHPFFDDEKSYSDEIYFYINSGATEVNVRIIEF